MTDQKRVYSVLINWADNDREQGEYGTYVRASDHREAERLAREDMRQNHLSNHLSSYDGDEEACCAEYMNDGEFGGSVLDCSPGVAWMAAELEDALRGLASTMMLLPDNPQRLDAWRKAESVLAKIDAVA